MAMSCTTLVSSTLSSTTPRHRRDICRGSHTLGPSSTPRRGGEDARRPHLTGPTPSPPHWQASKGRLSGEAVDGATRNIWS